MRPQVAALFAFAVAVAVASPAAFAQTAPSPPPAGAAAEKAPGGITRDAYIKRAARRAGIRFDRMDTNHDGVLTHAEIHAYYAARRRHRHPHPAAEPPPPPPPPPPKQQ